MIATQSLNRHPSAGWGLKRQRTMAGDASLRWHDKLAQVLRIFAPSREDRLSYGLARSREDTNKEYVIEKKKNAEN